MTVESISQYRAYVDEISGSLKNTLQRGLEFINCDKYIHKNSKVFVKPNFTFSYYKEGVTTNPEFLRSLLELLKSKADTVILGESDGGNHSFKADEAFKGHNMYEICEEIGVKLVNLSSLPFETIESKILGKTVKVQLPRMLLEEVDCFVSVPALKVHAMTTVSLSLKNLWGCVPDTMRCLYHQNLAHKLALIAKSVKPKIVVVDGIYALNKHGPMYGETVKTNLILVSNNPVVADALGARIMGFSPSRIRHIAVAERVGIGSLGLANVEISGEWEKYQRQFEITKSIVDRAATLLFCSEALAKLVMDSPLTPAFYKLVGPLRSSDEKEIADQMGKRNIPGWY